MAARTHHERAETNAYAYGKSGLPRQCLVPAMRVKKSAGGVLTYSQQVLVPTLFQYERKMHYVDKIPDISFYGAEL
jgi:hypothetical protein